ncbi:MAG: hypothetical protein M1814_006495 [Vezdaea aestivalis]|nr:MAG: hypothetical protein M1814_006495 [Vezdaea aestivalis]
MPCCKREKQKGVDADQRWDYINLADFRSTSCWTTFSYGLLYVSLIISVAVYAVDTFTAINLLAFNRWGSNVKPYIPFEVSKWIFAACIIASFVLVAFEWFRAIRVIKRDGVAESYLDPLAVRIQCIRMGKNGHGFRRFLVFGQLTKSKKGADYVALFTYFSFKTWLRLVLAEGPRVVVNALTLFAVLQSELLPNGKHAPTDGRTSFSQFWFNVGKLADDNKKNAFILGGMVFTMVIWVIYTLSLMIATVMYLLFLWHWVPSSDGTLSAYCKRKIDSRVNSIVSKTMEKAREKDETKRQLAEARALKKGERPLGGVKREPTLPVLFDEEKDLEGSTLTRQTTQSTLPPYSSRPPTRNGSETPDFNQQPSLPVIPVAFGGIDRNGTRSTHASSTSRGSSASLLNHAAPLGVSAGRRPNVSHSAHPSDASNASFARMHEGPGRLPAYGPNSRPPTSQGRRTPGPAPSIRSQRAGTPGFIPPPPSACRATPFGGGDYGFGQLFDGRSTPRLPDGSRQSPAPPNPNFPLRPSPSPQLATPQAPPPPPPPPSDTYVAFNPNRHPTGPLPRPPQRNMTDPGLNMFGPGPTPRSGTAPPHLAQPQVTYDDAIYDSYARDSGYELEMQPQPQQRRDFDAVRPPARPPTAGPSGGGNGGHNVF